MRIAPMVIPHLKTPTPDLWADAALSAMITHNDSASIASCVSFVRILWQLLRMEAPPEPYWWVEAFVDTAKDLEVDRHYRPRGGENIDFEGPVWQFVQEKEEFAKKLGKLAVRLATGVSWKRGWWLCPACKKEFGF